MARLFPAEPDQGTPNSERKVREYLASQLPDSWIVLHSKRIVLPAPNSRANVIERELDFLVIDPDRGYIGLEVKGGGIARDANGWTSTGTKGTHTIKDPGKQASDAVHELDRYLWAQRAVREQRVRPRFGWGVVFPDVDAEIDLGPDLPKTLVIDRTTTKNIRTALEAIFKFHSVAGQPIPRAALRVLLNTLAPAFELVPSLARRIEDETPAFHRLTAEQMRALTMLETFKRVAISGPAGTGKTLLAMEKARRLSEEGQRVLYLCYNRPLADHLASIAEGFTVQTFHSFCQKLARSASIPFVEPKDADARSRFWEQDAVDRLQEALNIYPDERYDAVVVDEGQDFLELWWVGVECLLKNAKKGTLYVFFDPKQDLYGGGPVESLDLQGPVALTLNCRNTVNIARYSSGFVDVSPELRPESPEGVSVTTEVCATEREVVDAVRTTLHRLTNEEKIPTSQIVIMTPRALENSAVWRARKLGNLSLVEFPAKPGPNEVAVTTLQRFKGLEADVVVLCEVDRNAPHCSARHLYVGTSRARHALVVIELSGP